MKRSKLELNIDILKCLARHGPLKLTHLMYKANVNCTTLKQYLGFLIQQSLVEKQKHVRRRGRIMIVYVITEEGFAALRYFREVCNALQLVEEAYKLPQFLY